MISSISITDYQPSNYEQIVNLWLATGLGNPQRGDNQQVIEQSLRIGGKLLVAKTQNGDVVGTSWITFDGRRLHLHHFGVHPSYQRQGIGDRLTVESLRFAKQMGYQIKLEVHQSNTAAITLYKKHGFAFLGDYDVYIIRDIEGIELNE